MMFRTSVGFDMRAPDIGPPASELYAAALEMCAYADQHGVDQINFQEHHGADDGYLPTPFLMGAAAGALTKRAAILLGAVVLPLHDPVEIAEQIAVCDLICGGRLHVVFGVGYLDWEFQAFRVPMAERGKRMDESIEVVKRALSGERFTHEGREIFVRPQPFNRPPHLYVGGGVPASAKRAARHGLGLWPLDDRIIAIYEEECRKLGREPGPVIQGTGFVHVSEDPDRTWTQIWPHVAHVAKVYAEWNSGDENAANPFHGLDNEAAIRASGLYEVVTPEQCLELAKTRSISLAPLIGGLPPKLGWESLELLCSKVIPKLA